MTPEETTAAARLAPGPRRWRSSRLDVLHVDMDCFFAAVEALDDPSLAGKPVIVGGTGARGVVASCSYEARATGVSSAMPMSEARRRCPAAVVIQGRHDRYGEVSRQLHEVLREFTPVIEPIAFDEAFLDVSGSHRLFGDSRRHRMVDPAGGSGRSWPSTARSEWRDRSSSPSSPPARPSRVPLLPAEWPAPASS